MRVCRFEILMSTVQGARGNDSPRQVQGSAQAAGDIIWRQYCEQTQCRLR